jgi:DNA-binding NarL/FixJ family response regulator
VLSRKEPHIPIVLLTGHPAVDTAMRAVRLGVVDYLFKPQEMNHLMERLDLAVHRARVLRSVGQAERVASRLSQRLDTLKQTIYQASSVCLGPLPEAPRTTAPLDPLRNLAQSDLGQLSAREREVLLELARGQSPQRIAAALQLSTNTVRNHLKSIFLKLRVNSQIALLAKLATPQR